MNKLLFIALVIALAFLFWRYAPTVPVETQPVITGSAEFGYIYLDNRRFYVEIADTPEKLTAGLQNRESIGEADGMLFIFSVPDRYLFWMKDTKIPLDILWIENGTVNYIVHDAEPATSEFPPSYNPPYPASYVLELPAGTAARNNIIEGSRFETDIAPR